jgi:hypothetical protein
MLREPADKRPEKGPIPGKAVCSELIGRHPARIEIRLVYPALFCHKYMTGV